MVSDRGLILRANASTATMLGLSRATLVGQSISRFIRAEDQDTFREHQSRLAQTGEPQSCEVSMERNDGTPFWAHLTGVAAKDIGGASIGRLVLSDITQRKQAEAALRESEQRLRAVVETTLDAVITMDSAGIITAWNAQAETVFGWMRYEAIGQTVSQLIVPPQYRDAHERGFSRYIASGAGQMLNKRTEITALRRNGENFPMEIAITAMRVGNDTLFNAFMRDITERKTAADEIERLAFYDPLTGRPNRRLLIDRLTVSQASCARHCRTGALLCIDLDNFRTINDTHGHHTGDLLLQQVAARLANCIRECETVARLGGAKFMVMLEDLSDNPLEAASHAEAVGERILRELSQPYQLGAVNHHSTLSIGITLFGEHPEDAEAPLMRADLALSQSKAAGRNCLCFFDPQLQAAAMTRAALEADLRTAVAQQQFVLYYQAQIGRERQLTGAEVLLRWKHPVRGLVSPAEFIPLGEDTGLILPLGDWVLETACNQLTAWAARAETTHLTIAVNVSPLQFHQRDFVTKVLDIVRRTGANPQRLKLELTEGMLISSIEDVIAKMSALQKYGIGLSLDDFGTGYSSLSYLKRLPLDQIKIDQSFIRDIPDDSSDASIAKMIIALADGLGLAVIAEGVETEEQHAFLAGNGCHAYQGYLYYRPVPLEEFEAFASRTSAPVTV